MKVAVVGTGVSGLAAAWALDRDHDVVLYEADPRAGGHVHTHSVDDPLHGPLAVDSGFIVYNERNYPGLVGLLSELGVATRESDMSFAVTCRRCRLEYCGRGAAGLFAERRNMLRPGFLRLLVDIGRFFRAGKRAIADPRWQRRTIGDFLDEGSYGRGFDKHFLAPMGAAIWSSSPDDMRSMPAAFFLGFFENHGLLGLRDAPLWRTVDGRVAPVRRCAACSASREACGWALPCASCAGATTSSICAQVTPRPSGSIGSSSPRIRTRRSRCSAIPPTTSAPRSAASATRATRRSCTPTPRCCRASRRPAPRGT